jgi:hypothetical protein
LNTHYRGTALGDAGVATIPAKEPQRPGVVAVPVAIEMETILVGPGPFDLAVDVNV